MVNQHNYILLNPGPVNITPRVRLALTGHDLCHREPEFSHLLSSVQEKLLDIYKLSPAIYSAVIITGSGTAAVEGAIISFLHPQRKVLILSNGVYGERMAKIASAYRLKMEELRFRWGEDICTDKVEQILKADDTISTIAVVHHETTTGLLNRLDRIGSIAESYGRELIVDGVSSFGGEKIDFSGWNIGVLCATANKCLHGVPGISFVIVKKDIIERQKGLTPRGVYLDLITYHEQEEAGIPPFTPSIPVLYALEEALDELLEQGVEERIALYERRSHRIRALSEEAGLIPYIPFSKCSSTLTSFYLPENISYEVLHQRLKIEGFIIYAGQGGLREDIFRVANMGDINMADIDRLFKIIRSICNTHNG